MTVQRCSINSSLSFPGITSSIMWCICQNHDANTGVWLLTGLQALFRFHHLFHECPFAVPGYNLGSYLAFDPIVFWVYNSQSRTADFNGLSHASFLLDLTKVPSGPPRPGDTFQGWQPQTHLNCTSCSGWIIKAASVNWKSSTHPVWKEHFSTGIF